MSKNIDLLFYIVLYMSFISTLVALAIMLIRWLIGRKLPTIFSYALWSLLLFRLLVPISFVSQCSIFNYLPISNEVEIIYDYDDEVKDTSKNLIIEDNYEEKRLNISLNLIPKIWILVTIVLFLVFLFSYLYSLSKFREGIIYKYKEIDERIKLMTKRNIRVYSVDHLDTPVVCGILKPKIIVPTYLTESENIEILKNVVIHETVHIKRKDNIIKILSIFTACIHWFNPIIWKSIILSHIDMERACDETVIKFTGEKNKKHYAQSLLSFALDKRGLINATTVAFGESNTKLRIKGILEYRKPNFIVKAVATTIFISCILLVATDASSHVINIDLNILKEERKEQWVELNDISTYVREAAIVSQDQNFDYHNGVDLLATVRASINTLIFKDKKQGASTITQQLIKNICDFNEINLINKKKSQINSAVKLEQKFSKEEILEAYLNSLYFGRNIRGIKSAAKFYFQKEPIDLTKEESAKLMSVIDNPKEYDIINKKENNENKAKQIIKKMESFK